MRPNCYVTGLSFWRLGDSDSTAVIACCCWGLLHGTRGVPEGNYGRLEYRHRLERSGELLYSLAY